MYRLSALQYPSPPTIMAPVACNTILPPWTPNLCPCFAGYLQAIAEAATPQYLYQIHQKSLPQCPWFLQAQQACKAHQISLDQERLARQQQQVEQARLAKQRKQEEDKARLEAEEKARLERFACRRCPAKFASNTKLHTHIRDRHAKKPTALPSPPSLPTPSLAVASPPATSTPKPSRLPRPIARLPPTPPPTPPQVSIPGPPKKPYMTVDDLYRMFAGRPKPIGLSHRQDRSLSPLSLGTCSPRSSTYLPASLPAKSTKTKVLASYHGPAKRRPAYHAPPRFSSSPSAPLPHTIVACHFCGHSTAYLVSKGTSRVETRDGGRLGRRGRRLL